VLFGSFAVGKSHEWSDIDFLVVLDDSVTGGEFERVSTRLWTLGQKIDIRIEPLTINENDWLNDDVTPVILVARETGVQLAA
jgi:predicted nucleotidyltransferase